MNLTDQIICRANTIYNSKLPSDVIKSVKRCLIDYSGCVLGGAHENLSRFEIQKKLRASVGTIGNATVFGLNWKTDILTAAFVNAFNAHSLELDDGNRFGMMHMGAVLISAILAAAENIPVNYITLLKSIVLSYDVSVVLARQMQPRHKLRGFHATGTCCTIGAAVGCSLLMGHKDSQMRSAISAAATSSSGLLEMIDNTSEMKPYNIAHASMAGLQASIFGGLNFEGPEDPISGKRGFYAVLADREDYDRVFDSKIFCHDEYEISNSYFKIYAACRHCHAPIEAALKIRNRIVHKQDSDVALPSNRIKSIKVGTYQLAVGGHNHTDILGPSSAKMSTPYSVSVAIIYGLYGVEAYIDEILMDKEVQKLTKKVSLYIDKELDLIASKKRGAKVEIELETGEVYIEQVDYPVGEPENPITDLELEEKCRRLITYSKKEEGNANKVIELIRKLDESWKNLYELLV